MTVRGSKSPDESTGWSRGRVMGYAIASLLAPVLLIAIFEARGGRRGSEPVATDPTPPSGPSTAASIASGVTAPTASLAGRGPEVVPVAPTAEPAPAPTEIAGRDSTAWRRALRSSAETSDWKTAADALEALASLDPAALDDSALQTASTSVAVAVGNFAPDLAPRAFEALGTTPGGVDVLYSVMSTRGGTKAAQHASSLLEKDAVMAKASAALRVTLELRKAACKDKESLLDRAVVEGDTRTLVLMDALRSPRCAPEADGCCLRDNGAVEAAARKLRSRVAPSAAPTSVPATASPVGTAAPKPPKPKSEDPY